MPNYIKPVEVMEIIVAAGVTKSKLPWLDLTLRGLFSGFLLACSSTLSAVATQQTGVALTGALLFPCGFIMIVLFGLELVTGNFLLIPISVMAGKANWLGMLKNWVFVWTCNLLGTSLYLAFFYGAITMFGHIPDGGPLGQTLIAIGKSKTIKYVEAGVAGWFACFFKGILCNFFVSFAVLASLTSTSSPGKIIAAWLPVVMFAALGYEHIVVDMFVVPCSMALGSGVTWGQWWGWSMVPATLGNLFGAFAMVSVPMWMTWGHEFRKRERIEAEKKLDLESPKEDNATLYSVDDSPPVYQYPTGPHNVNSPATGPYENFEDLPATPHESPMFL